MSPERLPSMNPRSAPRPFGRLALQSRHCFPGFAAGAQLPTRFHAHAVRARSHCERLFAGRARGHVRPIDFCNRKRSVSTPGTGPNSDTHTVACHCRSEERARESAPRRAFSGQGPRAFRSRFRPPPERPLASVDLPQPNRPEHPLSRTRVQREVENNTPDAHAVTRALSNESAWLTARSTTSLEGCRARALAKEARTRTAPRVPSAAKLTGRTEVCRRGPLVPGAGALGSRSDVAFFSHLLRGFDVP